MPRLTLTPPGALRLSTHHIPRHNCCPNTSIQRQPLLIYYGCIPEPTSSAAEIESHLKDVGVVTPQWRYTMYKQTHFHSTTHEVLCISSGKAKLCFGGEENPGRIEATVQKGDAIIIPAGVGHRLVEDIDGDFEMVGSYPKGKSWDMCYGLQDETEKVNKIKDLGWFEQDPLYGDGGPAVHAGAL